MKIYLVQLVDYDGEMITYAAYSTFKAALACWKHVTKKYKLEYGLKKSDINYQEQSENHVSLTYESQGYCTKFETVEIEVEDSFDPQKFSSIWGR